MQPQIPDDPSAAPDHVRLVSVRDLTVRFGRVTAVDRASLAVGAGITGLLGPNGAGKTTLLSVLSGGIRPAPGHVEINGHDLGTPGGRNAVRGEIGYLPQRFDLAGGLTLRQTVEYAAWCNGVGRPQLAGAADDALALVGLADRAQSKVRHLSGGQRQRLGLAAAVPHRPRVLLLDEPTAGLDPEQRVRFRGYLMSLASESCVILATHLLEDVQQAADRLVLLSDGDVAFSGTPGDLAAMGTSMASGLTDTAGESDLERGYRLVLERAQRSRGR